MPGHGKGRCGAAETQGGKGAGLGNCHRHGKNAAVMGAPEAKARKNRAGMKNEKPDSGFGFWGCYGDVDENPEGASSDTANKSSDDNQGKPSNA